MILIFSMPIDTGGFKNMRKETAKNGITFHRVNSDTYGNPRYVVHYLDLLTDAERNAPVTLGESRFSLALSRAHKIGGAKYRGRDFGGGIVFQSYSIDDTAEHIDRVKGGK